MEDIKDFLRAKYDIYIKTWILENMEDLKEQYIKENEKEFDNYCYEQYANRDDTDGI